MGIGSNPGKGAKFITIMNGKIVMQVDASTPEAIKRITKTDRTVHEIHEDYVEGHITDIKVVEKKTWIEWQIFINDGKDRFILTFPYSGGTATGFLSRIEACDFTKPVKICPYWIPREDDPTKHRAFCGLYQEGEKIESQYNKDNDYNGMPKLVEVKKGRKTVWDDTKRMEFFEALINDTVLPAIEEAKGSVETLVQTDIVEEAPQTEEEPAQVDGTTSNGTDGDFEDDLPF